MECKVCFEQYDLTDHRPRMLTCGHSFCTGCVGDLITNNWVTCPTCRQRTRALQGVQGFPYNYDLEEAVMKLGQRTESQGNKGAKTGGSCNVRARELKGVFQRLFAGVKFSTASLDVRAYVVADYLFNLSQGCDSRVLAVADDSRGAHLTSDDHWLYLHHLHQCHDQAYVQLPYKAALDYNTHVVFLELKCGTYRHTLFVKLEQNNPHAEQFFHMCTGWLGPSYAGSKFSKIYYQGDARERITGGDYDGDGGRPVLSGLPTARRVNRWLEGNVGWESKPRSTRFFIAVSYNPGYPMYNVFGRVLHKGSISWLENYVHKDNVEDILIEKCGVAFRWEENDDEEYGDDDDEESESDEYYDDDSDY